MSMSPITIGELRLLHTLIEYVAIHHALADHDIVDEALVTILVGDEVESYGRPRATYTSDIEPSWISFTVAGKQFAIWRHTGALHTVNEDGAVSDDPIHAP